MSDNINYDIETVPGNDSGDLSEITGTATKPSVTPNATDIPAVYNSMKKMMIGLEQHLICIDGAQTCNDSNMDRTPLVSVQTPPPPEATGST